MRTWEKTAVYTPREASEDILTLILDFEPPGLWGVSLCGLEAQAS